MKNNIIKLSSYLVVFFLAIYLLISHNILLSQTFSASPSNWLYPDGNLSATKYNKYPSIRYQSIDSMQIKWFSNYIRGDVQPLIGNIVHNSPIIENSAEFPFSPNEIAAVMGDTLVILDGAGKTLTNFSLKNTKDTINSIIGISALLDTSSSYSSPENTSRTLILGFETLEAQRSDSLAIMYLGGWRSKENQFGFLRRLALNLKYDYQQIRDYLPNNSASLKPIYARKRVLDGSWGHGNDSAGYIIFATANMSQPQLGETNKDRPYLRGLTSFYLHNADIGYPLPDEGDNYEYRIHLGPQVGFAQPSISPIKSDTSNNILLPCFATPVGDNNEVKNLQVTNVETYPNHSYLFNFRLNKDGVLSENKDGISFTDLLSEVNENRARVRSYFVELTDGGKGYPDNYILVATEYNGIGNPVSTGQPGLFLFDIYGTPLYKLGTNDNEQPFYGSKNHFWSVAVGNVDGAATNKWMPCYPNNPGNEIIVTQSSRDFVYAGSRLMILRYNSNPIQTPKASPPGTVLNNFDTICTYKIQGWVAAVNDIDGKDGKDEILLVAGSKIIILRMRDYVSIKFREGNRFDTVFTHTFAGQTITSAAISDVDGDGKNDIVVTTNEGIYVLGTPLERTIDITSFNKKGGYQTDWCFGDTVKIKWKNIIQGNTSVNILFQRTKNGVPTNDSLRLLHKDYPNNNDTSVYNLVVDTSFAGKEGKFIIQSSNNPIKNADTTGVIRFHRPNIETDIGSIDTIYIGKEFTVKGRLQCCDSIMLYYSFDSKEWTYLAKAVMDSVDNTFQLTAKIPCLSIFDCKSNRTDSTILGQIVYYRYNSIDSTNVYPLVIKPATFSLQIDTCVTACASRTIRWDLEDTTVLDGVFNVMMSADNGKTFDFLGTTPIRSNYYVWNAPTNVTTPVIVRLCSDKYCYKADTVIWNYQPKYIKTVAPNPLRIQYELEIIYQVDEDTEATIRIIDQANRYIKTIIKDEHRKGGFAYCERWNGRLDDNTPVANGMYYIMLELSNGIKEIYPLYIRN